MLHVKFSWKSARRFRRIGFLKGFYHKGALRQSWSCDRYIANKISFPVSKEAPHKIWLSSGKAVSEKNMSEHC